MKAPQNNTIINDSFCNVRSFMTGPILCFSSNKILYILIQKWNAGVATDEQPYMGQFYRQRLMPDTV